MNCPDCYSILSTKAVKYPVDAIVVHKCNVCDGIWIAGTSLKRLLTSEPSAPSYEKIVEIINQKNHLSGTKNCPSCENKKLHVLKIRGVELDYCESCNGMYFDKGELEGVIPKLKSEGFKYDDAGMGTYWVFEVITWVLVGIFSG
ncbi:MAG: hypothetical protein GKR92_12355 [Gammaproteobacteria bacterium]|nr:MAG: hypothetical protein GKR92_12355 [Gammaproteobacteria bacterium]